MTVDQLIDKLVELPADANVCLLVDGKYSEDFKLETTEDGYVMLNDQTWVEDANAVQ